MGIEENISSPRIVAICCVKNECDIIEAFVRHTLAFVDRLVVLDNGSSDGTLVILKALERDHELPIDVVEDASPGFWQWKRMTRLMKEFAVEKYRADWILALDVDEFIDMKRPKDFGGALSSMSGLVSIGWRTYVPHFEDNEGELNPVVRIGHRLEGEPSVWSKVIVPRSIAEQKGIQYGQGSHTVTVKGRVLAGTPIHGARLAHFPIRDPQQWASKIAMRALQYAAMPGEIIDGACTS